MGMDMGMEMRMAANPLDAKGYDTERLRGEFLIRGLFVKGGPI